MCVPKYATLKYVECSGGERTVDSIVNIYLQYFNYKFKDNFVKSENVSKAIN